jgi:hypothetical protein
MNGVIDRRLLLAALMVVLIEVPGTFHPLLAGTLTGPADTTVGEVVTDPRGIASFIPPPGWERWNFWGTTAFSPTPAHTPRITFTVTPGQFSVPDYVDTVMRDYVSTFSTDNYTLIEKENLYLGGWSGVRVLAQGTDNNTLFDHDYIWIQEYFTKDNRISLVFRCDAASFETYRDTVLKSFRTLVITDRGQDTP